MAFKIFEHLVVGPLQCNCYIVGDDQTNDAIVIDPGDEADEIMKAITAHGLNLVATVATHAHFDHVLAADAIRISYGVPFYLHEEDVPVLSFMQERGLKFMGMELPPPPDVDRFIKEGDTLEAGAIAMGVIHTPGHSPGSVSLVIPDEMIFSGDTLFAGSIGRTDLPGGDYELEISSIKNKLFSFGDLPVFPGHGESTTVDRERVANPFVGTRSGLWTP